MKFYIRNKINFGTENNVTRNLLLHALTILAVFCSLSVHAGSWQKNINIGGFTSVHIYTPDSSSTIGSGKALMLVLHGCVQPINQYLTANLEVAAEQYGMVIALPDAMNKAGYGCWSYWQGSIARNSGDYKNLITLANTMANDSQRNIDANQVYIAGLSSGATFAHTTACLAPDIFAGMGVSAGPSIGTSAGGAIGICETANVSQRCNQYAGINSSFLDTQIASIAHGDKDTTVNLCYNTQNADGMAALYGVDKLAGTITISDGQGRNAEETLWQRGRVSMLWFKGVGHAWSGGNGATGSYISNKSINYASYLGNYFLLNNNRVERNSAPIIEELIINANAESISISGVAKDSDGSVSLIKISITDHTNNNYTLDITADEFGNFSTLSDRFENGLYTIYVSAVDNLGLQGDSASDTVRIGPEPGPVAPVVSNLVVSVNTQCAIVGGVVVDENQNLSTVVVNFFTGDEVADINGVVFSAQRCGLPADENIATVIATDTEGLFSSESINFFIDAGQIATLDAHISAGRLDYTNYANCYLEYGTSPFKLNEVLVREEQCSWQDDDASCVGQLQLCSLR